MMNDIKEYPRVVVELAHVDARRTLDHPTL